MLTTLPGSGSVESVQASQALPGDDEKADDVTVTQDDILQYELKKWLS